MEIIINPKVAYLSIFTGVMLLLTCSRIQNTHCQKLLQWHFVSWRA